MLFTLLMLSPKQKKRLAIIILGIVLCIFIYVVWNIYKRNRRHAKFSGVFTIQSSTKPNIFPIGTPMMFSFRKSGFFRLWKFGKRESAKISDYRDKKNDDWIFADSYEFSNNDNKLVANFGDNIIVFKKEENNLIQTKDDDSLSIVWGNNLISDKFTLWDMIKSLI